MEPKNLSRQDNNLAVVYQECAEQTRSSLPHSKGLLLRRHKTRSVGGGGEEWE